MRWIGALLAAAVMAWAGSSGAAELGQPAGEVVLTVAGNIGATNRGPYDDFEDAFFKHHEHKFDKAAAFDLAMLEGLGMHEVTVAYSAWPRTYRFEGPWLKDVLAAVGASGHDIAVLALDGYAEEISAAELDGYDWILAVKRDGRYLDIGQHGPTWIVYARRDGKTISAEDEQRWPWAAFLIEVK